MQFVIRKRINKKAYGIKRSKNGIIINIRKLYLHIGRWKNVYNLKGNVDWKGKEYILMNW
jgi:hypothetical protein